MAYPRLSFRIYGVSATCVWRISHINGVCAMYVSLLWNMCDIYGVLGIFCGVPRNPVGRFAGSFRPESLRPGFMGGSFRPY